MKERKALPVTKKKWIGDFFILCAVDLKCDSEKNDRILKNVQTTFHERTGHFIPRENNQLQDEVDELVQFVDSHKMSINMKKTKAVIFNPLKSIYVLPQINVGDSETLEAVDSFKLLGQIFTSDLRTMENTKYIYQKANKNMWHARRLKELGFPLKKNLLMFSNSRFLALLNLVFLVGVQ